MQKDRIKKFKVPIEKQFVVIPNALPRDKRLSPLARLVLIYLLTNSDTWVVLNGYAAEEVGVNVKTFTGAIRELYNVGYIRRERIRSEKGYFSHWDYEVHYEAVFENEVWEAPKKRVHKKKEGSALPGELSVGGLQPSAQKPPVVKLPVVNARLSKPKEPMPNIPKAMKAMPSSISSSGAMEASPAKKPVGKQDPDVRGRKHKRPQAQEDTFQWLLGLKIVDENGAINEDTLSFLAHKYSHKKLEDTYFHLIHKLNAKGVKVKKSPLAFFRYLLENEHDCRGTNSELNEAFARNFAKELGWGSLEFKEKYVIDRYNSAKDISFNMEPAAFRESLSGLYMSLNGCTNY